MQKFTSNELSEIYHCIYENLESFGFVKFNLRILPLKKPVFIILSLFFLIGIGWFSFALWTFFIPACLFTALFLVSYFDMVLITNSLTICHNKLINKGIKIEWAELMDIAYDFIATGIHGDEDDYDDEDDLTNLNNGSRL